jgi:prevent-host-death family protein
VRDRRRGHSDRRTVTVLVCDFLIAADARRPGRESPASSISRIRLPIGDLIEKHGGTIVRGVGDGLIALFGVPVVHDDDALRAVRAAAAIREHVARLREELAASSPVGLDVRIGVNTGELVIDGPDTDPTFTASEPVQLAIRLQEAAAAGEILIGKATYPLVKDAVVAGPLESFAAKDASTVSNPGRMAEVEPDRSRLTREPGSEPMRRLTATHVARHFSDVLNRVAAGEAVEITRNNAPIAVLAPQRARVMSPERFREVMTSAPPVDGEFEEELRSLRRTVRAPEDAWPS